MRRQFVNGSVILKVALWYCGILGGFAAYTNWLPQIRGDAPEAAVAVDVSSVTPDMLKDMGMKIIYGSMDPLGVLSRGEGPIGKGQCPLCHQFFESQLADRCPNMMAMPKMSQDLLKVSVEARSHERVKESRYAESLERLADGEENSGITPHAETGGQYLIESEYCPNCFVVEGFGLKGTGDTVSPMPIINKPPIELIDTEIVAVVTYLQTRGGDMSKATAIEDWESYMGKTLGEGEEAPKEEEPVAAGPPVALGSETAEQIVKKMTCFACHKIPGIEIAKTGMIGPLLIEGSSAPNRIKSPEYKKAIADGKAHATTPREYVMESILDPGAFIVPGFADDMNKDFKHKFTVSGLDVLLDHLLAQTEATAIAEGMDRLPNEKEGSLKPAEAKIDNGEKTVKKSIGEFGDEEDAHLSIAGLENSHAKSFN